MSLWIAGIGTAASIGMGAYSLSQNSGGGGGGMSAAMAQLMAEYVRATGRDSNKMVDNVRAIADGLQTKVASLGDTYANEATGLEKEAIERLATANNMLSGQVDQRSETFTQDINKAIEDLTFATNVLGDQSRADTLKELSSYKAELDGLEGRVFDRTQADLLRADQDTQALSTGFRDESRSLGDIFLSQAKSAQDDYRETMGRAVSTDPRMLAEFSRAADQLSQAAVQTRMNMLATADPRALELSAIADENAAAMMSGRISSDVQANLARTGAMRALQGGFAGGQMQRNLEARDLGLTSLQLQQQGLQDFDRQRRLNFDTRVAGLQVGGADLRRDTQNLLAEQGRTMLGAQMDTATTNLNQRSRALEANLNVRSRGIEARRDLSVGLNRDVFSTRADTATEALRQNVANLSDVTANRFNTMGTTFNARTALGEQLFKTGLAADTDIYNTNVGAMSNFYQTKSGVAGDIFSTNAAAVNNASNLNATAQTNWLDARVRARTMAAGTMANAYQQDMLNNQQNTASRNATWASTINSAAALGGDIFGKMYQSNRNPSGWNNFDYGSGTGA